MTVESWDHWIILIGKQLCKQFYTKLLQTIKSYKHVMTMPRHFCPLVAQVQDIHNTAVWSGTSYECCRLFEKCMFSFPCFFWCSCLAPGNIVFLLYSSPLSEANQPHTIFQLSENPFLQYVLDLCCLQLFFFLNIHKIRSKNEKKKRQITAGTSCTSTKASL